MKEIYENAKKLMKGYCRVCKVCDGYACAGEVPGMGGLGTASSFKANVAALKEIRFNMRLIHDVTEPVTSVSILGKTQIINSTVHLKFKYFLFRLRIPNKNFSI
jgi:hypothetical protein